jgi:anti-anti-sigma factor
MRAHQQAAPPLVVIRSEAESGRVGLRLIGELDLHTVDLLEAELGHTRERSSPSVIDLRELRFLDLVGLRALLRAVESDVARTTRLVGATGIVRRLMDIAHTIDNEAGETARAPFPAEPRTRIIAQYQDQTPVAARQVGAQNGAAAVAASSISPNGEPT